MKRIMYTAGALLAASLLVYSVVGAQEAPGKNHCDGQKVCPYAASRLVNAKASAGEKSCCSKMAAKLVSDEAKSGCPYAAAQAVSTTTEKKCCSEAAKAELVSAKACDGACSKTKAAELVNAKSGAPVGTDKAHDCCQEKKAESKKAEQN